MKKLLTSLCFLVGASLNAHPNVIPPEASVLAALGGQFQRRDLRPKLINLHMVNSGNEEASRWSQTGVLISPKGHFIISRSLLRRCLEGKENLEEHSQDIPCPTKDNDFRSDDGSNYFIEARYRDATSRLRKFSVSVVSYGPYAVPQNPNMNDVCLASDFAIAKINLPENQEVDYMRFAPIPFPARGELALRPTADLRPVAPQRIFLPGFVGSEIDSGFKLATAVVNLWDHNGHCIVSESFPADIWEQIPAVYRNFPREHYGLELSSENRLALFDVLNGVVPLQPRVSLVGAPALNISGEMLGYFIIHANPRTSRQAFIAHQMYIIQRFFTLQQPENPLFSLQIGGRTLYLKR